MAVSYNASNLFMTGVVVWCCLIVIMAQEEPHHHLSRQIFLMSHPFKFANNFPLPYYNYRGQPVMMSTGRTLTPNTNVPYIYPPWLSGDSHVERRYNSRSTGANIFLRPHAKECLKDNVATDGGRTCKASSRASSGSIDIKFSEINQVAYVDITAPKYFSVTLICTDVTDTAVFTRGGQIKEAADTPRTQAGYMSIVSTSTAKTGTLKCSWFSRPN
ncbi:uncharacterized protein LOC130700784 [Daphnia carinata]|uniref:uncharacterized protein LOC130700784 n=1 Tax=Daphnia carinata TaxID=120202 RepID=UPI00257BC8BA|nr:uncharacterized protein LOC130700784 [Daphnia carinata]